MTHTVVKKGDKWILANQYGFPMGGYHFRTPERAQEILDCLARGGDFVDGYLIQPDEVKVGSSAVPQPTKPIAFSVSTQPEIVCERCGASSLNGAMFTTLAGGNICDDCF